MPKYWKSRIRYTYIRSRERREEKEREEGRAVQKTRFLKSIIFIVIKKIKNRRVK